MADPKRVLVTIATTTYTHLPASEQRPQLVDDLNRMRALFSRPDFGYTAQPLYDPATGVDASINPTFEQLRTGLDHILATRAPGDLVVVYYAGHGELLGTDDYLLALHDFNPDKPRRTGLPGSELARWLTADIDATLLLVLDTCAAGAVSAEFGRRVLHRGGPAAIITAARPAGDADTGFLTRALTRAVDDPAVAGHRPAYLPLDEIIRVITAYPDRPGWQHIETNLYGLAEGQPPFLPNPRHQPNNVDELATRRLAEDAARTQEQATFFGPRARGVSTAEDQAWRFTGRHQALHDLSYWLGHLDTDPTHRIITGDPGSGKSSVVARLCLLADPNRRNQIPDLDRQPPDTRPPDRVRIRPPIHAHGKTGDQILTAIATACDTTAAKPGDLIAHLAARHHDPIVIAVDALDEATDPATVAATIIRPLLDAAPVPLSLIVGTRDHLLDSLGLTLRRRDSHRVIDDVHSRVTVIDLDAPRYLDRTALTAYAHRCLRDTTPDSPYRTAPAATVDAAATAVGDAAGRSFLVAYLTSYTLASQPLPTNIHDPSWQARLPRNVGDAMRHDLDTRFTPDEASKVRDLLLPLAFAEGDGLPWSDLWAPFAATVADRAYTNTDIEWLHRHAGSYLTEIGTPTGASRYRLFHQALADHLRHHATSTGLSLTTIHASFDRVLRHRVPTTADGLRWSEADDYTRTHLATHAAHAGVLDTLVADPWFLLAADPDRLLPAAASLTDADNIRCVDAYRTAVHHLRTAPPRDRAAYLHLAATQLNARTLLDRISPDKLPWHAAPISWRPHAPHQTLTGHTSWVSAVAVGRVGGRDVIVSAGDDATVRLWDVTTRSPIGDPLTGHTGEVTAVAMGRVGGRDVIVSAGHDATVRFWDATTRSPIGDPLTGHTGEVTAVAMGRVGGRDVIVSAGHDATVRLWDAATGTAAGNPITGHTGGVYAVAVGRADGRDVIVSAGYDGTVRVWDATTHTPVADPLTGHTGEVYAVAMGRADGRDVIVSAGNDGTVRIWDATTHTPIGDPLYGDAARVRAVAAGRVDGRDFIVSAGDNATVRVWDATTHSPIGNPLTGHIDWVRAVAVGRFDGRDVIVSAGFDATVRVWDATTHTPIGNPLTGHTDWVRAVAVGQFDGRDVIVSGDSSAVIAHVSGRIVRRVDIGTRVNTLALTHHGMAVVGADRGILVLTFNDLHI